MPEHFDAGWRPLPDFHREQPAHPFRPYGATIGHALEWSRLCVELHAALGPDAPGWLVDDARELFARAVADGWAADGADGFVYTTDWDGTPVVRQRMHWVAAEAVAAASSLERATGDSSYGELHQQWWKYVDRCFLDRRDGSWHHELDPGNRPDDQTWQGKPDVYHAFQATVVPRLPLAPTFATALALGQLDR
jgi:sulfoquinovose isomerase